MRTPGINLYKHFKIWLSTNKEDFLPVRNRGRILQMRETNSAVKITLIYSQKILSLKSELELLTFCKQNNLTALAYENFKESLTDPLDLKVCQCIDMEVTAMADKNPVACAAAASDMLRVVVACNGHGIYSDFDVSFDLSTLSEEHRHISSNASMIVPLLTNLGWTSHILNNDLISTPNPHQDEITSLKNHFISAYMSDDFRYESLISIYQLSDHYSDTKKWRFNQHQHKDRMKNKRLTSLSKTESSEYLNPIQIRHKIKNMSGKHLLELTHVSYELYLQHDLPRLELAHKR